MRISINNSKWYDELWAAFIYFTQLPLRRIYQPQKDSFKTVLEYWPLTGWLTGGLMALTLYFSSMFFPYAIAVLLAIAIRMLLTGGLYEVELAHFLDGFCSGGRNKQRILEIMKDPHTNTYGMFGLIIYIIFLFFTLYSMSPRFAALTIFAADPYCKMVASQITQMLPYAQTEQESNIIVGNRKIDLKSGISLLLQGMLPLIIYMWLFNWQLRWDLLIFVPCLTMYFLYLLILNRLKGYTVVCCWALSLLIELSFYLVASTTFTNMTV